MNQSIPAESWHKSTYSASQGDCVEVADTPAFSAVRDTQNRGLSVLTYDSTEWRAFLRTAKADLY